MKCPAIFYILFSVCYPSFAHSQKETPHTSVPKIARLLGVHVGYNGQEALERTLGQGKRFISGHPNSRQIWRTRRPRGVIETDGFNINKESYVLEELSWTLADAEKSFPIAKRLPKRSGWLGTISLGATKSEVERLTRRILPPPQKQVNIWTWQAKGFVLPSGIRIEEAYRLWTATLGFRQGRLVSIDLMCE